MTVIAKKIGTYVSSKNLGISPKERTLFLRKVPFSLGNLSPSSKKIQCCFEKLLFSSRNFYHSMGNLLGIGT
jgi:hypothetical protein